MKWFDRFLDWLVDDRNHKRQVASLLALAVVLSIIMGVFYAKLGMNPPLIIPQPNGGVIIIQQ